MRFPFDKNIILEDARVRIEPLTSAHVDPLTRIVMDNPGLVRYSPTLLNHRDDLIAYVQNQNSGREKRIKYAFAIFDKQQNAYAGSSSYLHISDRDSHLEIGSTWIGKKFQRSGLNRHMKFLMLRYAFETLGAIRVAFRTDDRNVQSKTAIQAIGAVYEGTLRKHMVMPDGHLRDTVCYSILAEEWPMIQSGVFKKMQE